MHNCRTRTLAWKYTVEKSILFSLNPHILPFHISDTDCELPRVVLHLNKTIASAREILPDEDVLIRSDVVFKCNRTGNIYAFWEVSTVDEIHGEFIPQLNIEDGHSNFSLNTRDLSVGLSYVRFVLKATSAPEQPESFDYGFVRRLPPLIAEIRAPNVVAKGAAPFTLDGSMSRDTSRSVDDEQNMSFTWLCKRENETLPLTGDPPVDIGFGEKQSEGGCFGYGQARLNSTERIVVINPDRMQSKQVYIFALVVRKGKRKATNYHRLEVILDCQLIIR